MFIPFLVAKIILQQKSKSGSVSFNFLFNPLSPMNDQHQSSPCNINALENRVVMRITDMITQDVFA